MGLSGGSDRRRGAWGRCTLTFQSSEVTSLLLGTSCPPSRIQCLSTSCVEPPLLFSFRFHILAVESPDLGEENARAFGPGSRGRSPAPGWVALLCGWPSPSPFQRPSHTLFPPSIFVMLGHFILLYYFFFHVQSLFKNFYFSATGDMQYDISFSVRRVILSVCGSRHATGRLACNEDGPTG